ncbi:MAG: condensation domain-containing protein [Lachnospiraceae bacterium]|nr:condensation domain-containing protein [Lachnospiraceae bacterium]
MSVDFCGEIRMDEIKKAIEIILEQDPIFRWRIHQNEYGECYYIEKERGTRSAEILCTAMQRREEVIERLSKTFLDIERGEMARFVLQSMTDGVRMFMCVHHIIADGKSLLCLMRDIIYICCGRQETYEEERRKRDFVCENDFCNVKLDKQMNHLRQLVNLRSVRRVHSSEEAKELFCEMTAGYRRTIREWNISGSAYERLLQQCKKKNVTITSYLTAKIFEEAKVDGVSLPVDLRKGTKKMGNFVGRIDIMRCDIEKAKEIWEKAEKIHKILQSKKAERTFLMAGVKLLADLEPTFVDDMIYAQCRGEQNQRVTQVSKILRYKEKENIIGISNLNKFEIDTEERVVSNLFFYPPAAIERRAMMGVVSFRDQMSITCQKLERQ